MGNTSSQQGVTPEQIYAQYIQQQQDLIFQQQQQINKLYQMNMSNQTQANMFLQTSLYSSQNQQQSYGGSLPKLPSASSTHSSLDSSAFGSTGASASSIGATPFSTTGTLLGLSL